MEKPLFRHMRLLVMYDLPSKTKSEKSLHSKFRNKLLSFGFVQMQESVYIKHCNTPEVVKRYIMKINKEAPKEGDVRVLSFTEKQYYSMIVIRGEVSSEEYNLSSNSLERY